MSRSNATVVSPISRVEPSAGIEEQKEEVDVEEEEEKKPLATLLDQIFRFLIPCIFLIFNIIYFSYYLSEGRVVWPF